MLLRQAGQGMSDVRIRQSYEGRAVSHLQAHIHLDMYICD